mgnify:FL=1
MFAPFTLQDHRTAGDRFLMTKIASLPDGARRAVEPLLEGGVPCPHEVPDDGFAIIVKTASGATHRRYPIFDAYNALASAVVLSQEEDLDPGIEKVAKARVAAALRRFSGDSGASGLFGDLERTLEKVASADPGRVKNATLDFRSWVSGFGEATDQANPVAVEGADAFADLAGLPTSRRQRFVVELADDGHEKVAALKVANLAHLLNERPADTFGLEIEIRKSLAEDKAPHLVGFLDAVFEKTASRAISMSEAVDVLERFDDKLKLADRYGHTIREPEAAVFGDTYTPEEAAPRPVYERLADHKDAVVDEFGEDFFNAVSGNQAVFDSLPDPHKETLAGIVG